MSSERLIVTDVVQVVGSSGLACCLQGMSRTSSPNPESIRAKLDVVLSGRSCEGFQNLDYMLLLLSSVFSSLVLEF